jgi:nucleotide-binding universal stress UspA family protein
MKKILFPTDFSETSFNAFKYALEIANKIEAEILVLHAYESKNLTSSRLSPKTLDSFKENIELKEFENFKSYVQDFRKVVSESDLDHINLNFILEYGYLLPIIQEVIKKEKIDLVVMGTNNDEDFETSILGSNTYNVIVNTEIPTLCIPKLAKYKKFEKMAFSTVFSTTDQPAFEYFVELTNKNNAEGKCIYVDNKNKKIDNILSGWKALYTDSNLEFVILNGKDPIKTVVDYIEEEKIDLLTVVKHNKTFFESIFTSSFTKQIANKIAIPLLVVHD